jgi:hypothetical protein
MHRAFSVSGISCTGKYSDPGVPAGNAPAGNGNSLISFFHVVRNAGNQIIGVDISHYAGPFWR